MEPRCYLWDGIRLFFYPKIQKIIAIKCSIVKDVESEILKEWTIDEFEKLPSIYEELEKVVHLWSPCHSKQLQPFGCFDGVKECFCEKMELKHVEVAFISECNLKCRFCAAHSNREDIKHLELNKRLKDLYFKTLESIKGHNLSYIRLTDFGEPLYFRDEILNYIKSLSVSDTKALFLTTNGTLINNEFIRLCRKSKFIIYPIISVNAYSREHYIQKMGFDFFDRVNHNIFALQQRHCPFKVSFLIDETSDEELQKYLPYFQKLKDNNIMFTCYPANEVVEQVKSCKTFDKFLELSGLSRVHFFWEAKIGKLDAKKVCLLDEDIKYALN